MNKVVIYLSEPHIKVARVCEHGENKDSVYLQGLLFEVSESKTQKERLQVNN